MFEVKVDGSGSGLGSRQGDLSFRPGLRLPLDATLPSWRPLWSPPSTETLSSREPLTPVQKQQQPVRFEVCLGESDGRDRSAFDSEPRPGDYLHPVWHEGAKKVFCVSMDGAPHPGWRARSPMFRRPPVPQQAAETWRMGASWAGTMAALVAISPLFGPFSSPSTGLGPCRNRASHSMRACDVPIAAATLHLHCASLKPRPAHLFLPSSRPPLP